MKAATAIGQTLIVLAIMWAVGIILVLAGVLKRIFRRPK